MTPQPPHLPQQTLTIEERQLHALVSSADPARGALLTVPLSEAAQRALVLERVLGAIRRGAAELDGTGEGWMLTQLADLVQQHLS